MPRYDARRIEAKWQQYWDEHETFKTGDFVDGQDKLYVLDMFPYPSGDGLHVGHPEGYTATDIVCRYSRMRGKQVLHPMGWDAFGLPAEQHAIKTGTHPSITTYKNIGTFRRQLKMLGFSYDWSREFSTTDPGYFRWTQWIFLQIFDTWYDPDCEWTGSDGKTRTGRGRPISELPIPDDVQAAGEESVRRYQDKHRLAYQHEAPVNWCRALGTVLSNEEVNAEGLSERGQHPVERLPLRQWMLRITAYAERLIEELDDVDWSESIKLLQRNWIGRSEGAEVDFFIGRESDRLQAEFENWKTKRPELGFPADPDDDVLRVYTTRPDTLFGATYMVLAPEHPSVDRLTTDEQRESVEAYRRMASLKSDLDRTDLAKEKTGVFTGSYAVNPVNGEQIPIWIADYVLISYGTGAIMAVPGHDERDIEFANQFSLPIKCVVTVSPQVGIGVAVRASPFETSEDLSARADVQDDAKLNAWREWKRLVESGNLCLPDALGEGATTTKTYQGMTFEIFGPTIAVNSGEDNDDLTTAEFKQKIIGELHRDGLGRKAVNYRLRDWLFSRQHFWGEPFPIWHELDADGNLTGLLRTDPENELPASLPENFDFKPHGRPDPPLAEAPDEWLYKTAEDGTKLKRETNSMPQWAGSCWYYIRFTDPKNEQQFVDPEIEKRWLPVDLYIGGAEHAVLHLLYARFWHKVLFDRGHVSMAEPFQRLVNQGMILGDNGEKMSKARGNVVNPDDVVEHFGADSLRLYEMFMGPLEQVKPWSTQGVEGVSRFLGRAWRMIVDERADEVQLNAAVQDVEPNDDQIRILHKTVKAVTEDIEKLSFNTAISRMMEFTNEVTQQDTRPKSILEPFVLLLSPFAPHIAEELWQLLNHDTTLAYEPWPNFDESKLVVDELEIPVQINGKLRALIKVPVDADQAAIQQAAEQDETIAKQLEGKNVIKVIVVPGRLVNFVVK